MQYAMIFHYEDQRDFRTFEIDGEPWFVLSDVCRALEIKNPSDAAARLDDDEKGIAPIETLRGTQRLLIINESGLYSVVLRSDKPEARRFKKWITSEVLPSIRRTGAYGRRGIPRFIRRYNDNWDRIDEGCLSIISELAIRLWGRLERVGHIIADFGPNGMELRPDVSVGRIFSRWLKQNYPAVKDNYTTYMHKTAQAEFPARQYPNSMLPLYILFIDTVWIPKHFESYFKARDPAALAAAAEVAHGRGRAVPTFGQSLGGEGARRHADGEARAVGHCAASQRGAPCMDRLKAEQGSGMSEGSICTASKPPLVRPDTRNPAFSHVQPQVLTPRTLIGRTFFSSMNDTIPRSGGSP